MMPRPRVFISTVTKELKSARQLVANTLQFLGYEPEWQDIFGTEQGDLRAMLRQRIDRCKGVVQIVGQCYGAEPHTPDDEFGRVSYTQYETLYARQRNKKIWYLILDEDFPCDPHDPEPEELRDLQRAYRERVRRDTHLHHRLSNEDALKNRVLEIRRELVRLRREAQAWAAGVVGILLVILTLVVWLVVSPPFRLGTPPATPERARMLFAQKDYAAAFDAYSQLSDADPANVEYHRRTEECARSGHLTKSFLDRYLALVARKPANAIFRNYLGNAYLMVDPQDRDGKARGHYEIALQLDPGLSAPLANLGILAYRAGKPKRAEAFFKRHLAAEPDDAQGWVNLGLLYVAGVQADRSDARMVTSADAALRRAIRIQPGSSAAYKGLGRLYAATGRKKEALDAFQRSYALDDGQPEVRQQIELLAWESGAALLSGTAADDFTTRDMDGGGTKMPVVVVVMRFLQGEQFQQAEAACIEWTKAEPENPLPWRLLGRAQHAQGRTNEAFCAFAEVDRILKPGSPQDAHEHEQQTNSWN